jgi:hypothetical protein
MLPWHNSTIHLSTIGGSMTVQSAGREAMPDIKVRRPLTMVLLSIVTFGIYSAVWYYKVNREMRDFGAARGDPELAASKPWKSVLAVTIGGLLIVPSLVSWIRTVRRVQAVERSTTGVTEGGGVLIALIVCGVLASFGCLAGGAGVVIGLFGGIASLTAMVFIQRRLNTVWEQSGVLATPNIGAGQMRVV